MESALKTGGFPAMARVGNVLNADLLWIRTKKSIMLLLLGITSLSA